VRIYVECIHCTYSICTRSTYDLQWNEIENPTKVLFGYSIIIYTNSPSSPSCKTSDKMGFRTLLNYRDNTKFDMAFDVSSQCLKKSKDKKECWQEIVNSN
jgi:hypothetical protein